MREAGAGVLVGVGAFWEGRRHAVIGVEMIRLDDAPLASSERAPPGLRALSAASSAVE